MPPPADAVAWVEATVGSGSRVVASAPFAATSSSAVDALVVELRSGAHRELVLRRYLRHGWIEREPDLAAREAEALRLLEACPVATPVVVGVDPDGAETGAPSVLMSRLPGRPGGSDGLDEPRLVALADLLPPIHATPVPVAATLRPYRPYYLGQDLRSPIWSRDPGLWERAIAVHRAAVPAGRRVLVHRDFHPANVLFDGPAPSGVVDWAATSFGRPEVDVGHCRVNLAVLASLDAADRFRDAWLAASGTDRYDPTFDVLAAVGGLPEGNGFLDHDHEGAERIVARALAELGR